MAGGGAKQREGGAVKTTVVVVAELGPAWLTMETAFNPFLERFRAAISRSDPDDDEDNRAVVAPGEEDAKSSDYAERRISEIKAEHKVHMYSDYVMFLSTCDYINMHLNTDFAHYESRSSRACS